MNSYYAIEMQAFAHMQELGRQSAMNRLAAQVGRIPRAGYRQHLARSLRAFASRIDPSYGPLTTARANAG